MERIIPKPMENFLGGPRINQIPVEKNVPGSSTMVDASTLEPDLDFRITKGVINPAPDGTSSGDVAFTNKIWNW